MNKFVKELVISIVFVFSSFVASSRSVNDSVHEFLFSYDASGNRIQRMKLKSAQAPLTVTSKETSKEVQPLIEEKLEELSLNIYPNPTTGIINLDIKGVENEKVRLFIFSIQGMLLDEYYVNNGITNINITKYPTGLYLMKVIFKDKTSELKIVKQ
jgi:hypothetical protein